MKYHDMVNICENISLYHVYPFVEMKELEFRKSQ